MPYDKENLLYVSASRAESISSSLRPFDFPWLTMLTAIRITSSWKSYIAASSKSFTPNTISPPLEEDRPGKRKRKRSQREYEQKNCNPAPTCSSKRQSSTGADPQ